MTEVFNFLTIANFMTDRKWISHAQEMNGIGNEAAAADGNKTSHHSVSLAHCWNASKLECVGGHNKL